MPFTVTLNSSILIQDTGGTSPVTVTTKSVTDQQTAQAEFRTQEVTVPDSTVDQSVDLTSFKFKSLYVQTSSPITMKLAGGGTAIPVRKLCVLTDDGTAGITELLLSNSSGSDAQVFISLGSIN